MKLKKVRIIAYSLVLGGIGMAFVPFFFKSVKLIFIMGIPGLLLLFSGLTFMFFRWRCPVCDLILPNQGSFGMHECPFCGHELDL